MQYACLSICLSWRHQSCRCETRGRGSLLEVGLRHGLLSRRWRGAAGALSGTAAGRGTAAGVRPGAWLLVDAGRLADLRPGRERVEVLKVVAADKGVVLLDI